jgi:hypothetical protein
VPAGLRLRGPASGRGGSRGGAILNARAGSAPSYSWRKKLRRCSSGTLDCALATALARVALRDLWERAVRKRRRRSPKRSIRRPYAVGVHEAVELTPATLQWKYGNCEVGTYKLLDCRRRSARQTRRVRWRSCTRKRPNSRAASALAELDRLAPCSNGFFAPEHGLWICIRLHCRPSLWMRRFAIGRAVQKLYGLAIAGMGYLASSGTSRPRARDSGAVALIGAQTIGDVPLFDVLPRVAHRSCRVLEQSLLLRRRHQPEQIAGCSQWSSAA